MNKQSLYWIFQFAGWILFILLNGLLFQLQGNFDAKIAGSLFSFMVLGILMTHVYRWIIIKQEWLTYKIIKIIPRVLFAAFVFSMALHYCHLLVEYLFGIGPQNESDTFKLKNAFPDVINIAFIFIFWSLIYFLFHYIQNYRRVEIENLKWQASINEIELNKLKSQLNPHFIFNAMNSIRALIDENPEKAKNAVTHLSTILRNTLQMGKKKLISFDEELTIVKDYIELEAVRYEERLKVKLDIDPGSSVFVVPPLMIQTLVENAIKHGISKLPAGGKLEIISKVINNKLHITISNEGIFNDKLNENKGFGIKNTLQRLELLYGDNASFKISNSNGFVVSVLEIPRSVL
jgi:two-component system LytT family sensor kinase